ncbi:MAG: NAD-dependent epimerase/dehydratase family protein [Christensenellales bacterium]|jgi:nucleoside-diphosphate-sugar epimerase
MFNEEHLNDLLSTPSQALVEDMQRLDGNIMVLGAGGKIGPTLTRMALRAVQQAGTDAQVWAVSRFTEPGLQAELDAWGARTVVADLNDPVAVAALPKVPNILYLAGRKFGTQGNAHETWAMNVSVPTLVTRHFGAARYVVYSTGNVYPLVPLHTGGCTEEVPPDPVGEYAMTSLGRERVFEYAAAHLGAQVVLFRLNYAVDLRYGVLYDIAENILAGKPVSLRTPVFNCVWQRYVNEVTLRCLLLAGSEVTALNITGPETASVQQVAQRLGALLGKQPLFEGDPGERALLSNAGRCMARFGYPDVSLDTLIQWQAQWLLAGGRTLNKPTHFEEQEGRY